MLRCIIYLYNLTQIGEQSVSVIQSNMPFLGKYLFFNHFLPVMLTKHIHILFHPLPKIDNWAEM